MGDHLAVKTPFNDGTHSSQRRTPRRVYRRPMGILVAGHYEVVEGRSLSEGGVSFLRQGPTATTARFAYEEFVKGVRINISLILPSGAVIILRGEVVYQNSDKSGSSVGVKFDEVPLQQRREIRAYVSAKQVGEAELN